MSDDLPDGIGEPGDAPRGIPRNSRGIPPDWDGERPLYGPVINVIRYRPPGRDEPKPPMHGYRPIAEALRVAKLAGCGR